MPQQAASAPAAAAVLAIVAEVLNVAQVAPDDDFYDFGGSSLQAMRICARLEKDLRIKAAPEALFEAESLGDFATGLVA